MKRSNNSAYRSSLIAQGAPQGIRAGRSLILISALMFAPASLANAQDAVEESDNKAALKEQAQRYLEAAKRRLEERKGREESSSRTAALDVAMESAVNKAREIESREEDAQLQIREARERKLKEFYKEGLSLYRRGSYGEAIQVLEQIALLDSAHPINKSAQELISRADLKRFEQRLRASSKLPADARGAMVSELEYLLQQKRIELETILKYAKLAVRERDYAAARKLLTGILVQDPNNRKAQQLLEQVQMARLKEEEDEMLRKLDINDQKMINDVLKSQVLPETQFMSFDPPLLSRSRSNPMMARLQETISLDFRDVALGDVLDFLADAGSISIIPSPELDLKTRRVSLKANEMPMEHVLKYLAKNQELAYRVEQDAVLLATAEEFSSQPMQTRVLHLKSGLGPFTLETAAIQSNSAMPMESIKSLIEQTIPQPSGSQIVVDERTGALIVTNTNQNIGLTEDLLDQVDITPVQLLIEARFVEVVLTELEHAGLEAILNDSVDLTKRAHSDGTGGPGHQIASGGGYKFGSLSREDEALNLTLEGVLTSAKFEAVLHLLEEDNKSKTLSAPRITTLNNQTALIRVVEEFRYPTRYEVSLVQFDINGDGDFDDAGETEFANVPQDFQKRDIGILLYVTPSVGRGNKSITLVLAPEVSQFSQFRDLGGGVTVPEFTSSQLTTTVSIEDGQTVVLGGLIKDTTTETVNKVPLLGDVPFFGGLFRQTELSSTRRNLLIFITARVMGTRETT